MAPSEVPQQQLRPLRREQLAQQQLQPPPPPPPQQQPDGELAALKSRLAQLETRSVQWAAQVSFDTSGPLGADWQPLSETREWRQQQAAHGDDYSLSSASRPRRASSSPLSAAGVAATTW